MVTVGELEALSYEDQQELVGNKFERVTAYASLMEDTTTTGDIVVVHITGEGVGIKFKPVGDSTKEWFYLLNGEELKAL